MSVPPPPSDRPTGPPSGPLSGPSRPSPEDPTRASDRPPPGSYGGGASSGGPGGSGGSSGSGGSGGGPGGGSGDGGRGGHAPWWRSAPRVALIAALAVVAVVVGLVVSRSGDKSSGSTTAASGEVFLQPAAKSGPDPFTESTATDSSTAPVTPAPASPAETGNTNATRGIDGSAAGLYGGTQQVSSCDTAKQSKALQADPAKNRAFASVAGVQPSGVPAYLRSLTPVQLRLDTRVTNHGYRDGAPTSYQSVLQAGTAVLVDSHGVPRVRCACGNPLTPPVAQQSAHKVTGDRWSGYHPQNVVVVNSSVTVINVFVLFDPDHDSWFHRHRGDDVHHDQKTDPPPHQPSPSASTSSPAPSGSSSPSDSPAPCVSTSTSPSTGGVASPSGSASSCGPSSSPPSSSSPSTSESPSSSPSPSSSALSAEPVVPPSVSSDVVSPSPAGPSASGPASASAAVSPRSSTESPGVSAF
ncbi:hypothetical protein OK074_2349 [Actinobacteria bacterium OK074]|nr:hypothetical protein OK074_2349 [Actinobacteria bacterium OK074]